MCTDVLFLLSKLGITLIVRAASSINQTFDFPKIPSHTSKVAEYNSLSHQQGLLNLVSRLRTGLVAPLVICVSSPRCNVTDFDQGAKL